jgi:hypothetical protein
MISRGAAPSISISGGLAGLVDLAIGQVGTILTGEGRRTGDCAGNGNYSSQ